MQRNIILPILALLLVISGCEDVIDVDLNDANPVIVIEGDVDVRAGFVEVVVSRTTSFFANEDRPFVEDAEVTLFVEGNPLNIPYTQDGRYSASVSVVEGQMLELVVVDGDQTYRASEEVPPYIPMDSLSSTYFEPNSFFDGGSIVNLYFQDIPNVPGWLRIRLFQDGEEFDEPDDINVGSDEFSDGQYIDFPVFGYIFDEGDSVSVIAQLIPESTYDYYEQLAEITNFQGGGGSAAPANPDNNWTNGALGLFNVYQADTVSTVIPAP